MDQKSAIAQLIAYAEDIGITQATRLSPEEISVESRLAAYCREPKCPYYGQSMSCPPHVSGPVGFKKLLAQSQHAIVLRLEVDSDSLHGEDRPAVMRLLHSLAAAVELEAGRIGFEYAQAFAGGSCKRSFCNDHDSCAILSGESHCRFPDEARQSMSGFGVNVGDLMKKAGWSNSLFTEQAPDDEHMAWLAGLVLLG